MAALEGTSPPADKFQSSPWRTFLDSPLKGEVVAPIYDGTTSARWCIPPGDLGGVPFGVSIQVPISSATTSARLQESEVRDL